MPISTKALRRARIGLFIVGFIYTIAGLFAFSARLDLVKSDEADFPEWNRNRLVKVYPACPIPQLDPYDRSIQQYLKEKPLFVDCQSKFPLLFNSTHDFVIIPAQPLDYFKERAFQSCHYRTVTRNMTSKKPDDNVITSSQAYPISLTRTTVIPLEHEFLAIYCKKEGRSEILMDVHAFVPLKIPGSRIPHLDEGKMKWNVLIVGLDAVSRMNFLRTMPKTYQFLRDELGAVEMLGYNKAGLNSYPCIVPLMTSKKPPELNCTSNESGMDGCPFIWKEYSNSGYLTSFSEDSPQMGLFSSHGFKQQPTDYYTRALMRLAETEIKSHNQTGSSLCYGPRLAFQFLLDYMRKFVGRMGRAKLPFFQFTWSTALTHDHLNAGLLGDQYLYQSLKWMKESGHLEQTILILMSDHGNRISAIRNSVQGSLEQRLPLMQVLVPDAFKERYKLAYQNLLNNADKLVTLFDLHATLRDILFPEAIEDSSLEDAQHLKVPPRGISLFRPVPEDRTCAMAGIKEFFCSCNHLTSVPVNQTQLTQVAETAVNGINSLLKNSSACAKLELDRITFAQRAGRSEYYWEAYLVNFLVKPGGGQFEALVTRKKKQSDPWTVQGELARTNVYGNQSRCVTDVKLKPFCYCTD